METPAELWPCLTHDLPGIGGKVRECKEDFFVEEVPLYTPSGSGTHLYLLIEKQGSSTFEAVGKLAKALDRKTAEFGFAGLKDSDAVTRQYISIEHVSKETVENLHLEKIKILEATFHQNKLKIGHLKGNRFKILIRNPVPDALQKARPIVDRIQEIGMPNFFGPQRFGLFGNTHLLGRAILKKDFKSFVDILVCTPRTEAGFDYDEIITCYKNKDYEGASARLGRRYKYESKVLRSLAHRPDRFDKAVAGIDKKMLQFYYSAFQSDLFNRYLIRRLSRIHLIEAGDIAFIHRNGASFLVESVEQESPRVQNFEISASGPVFGSKMLRAHGDPGQLEAELLKESGFELEEIKGMFGIRLRGARRPLRVPIHECSLEEKEEGLLLSFFLPLGSYATVILHEIMKNEYDRLM
ncbi:MAG: tRNA pseudouridine(13) synthase TruD [Planctomycetota bacterium]